MTTLLEMANEAAEMVGATNTTHVNVCRKSIKRRYREMVQANEWPELQRETLVQVESGVSYVSLPFYADKLLSVYNTTTNRSLEPLTPQQMTQVYGSEMSTSGSLDAYIIDGVRGSRAETLLVSFLPITVKSSSAGDSCTVYLEGFENTGDNGGVFSVTGVVNGLSPVFLTFPSGVEGAVVIDTFSKDKVTTGEITLTQNGHTVDPLAIISAKGLTARYTWLRFNHTADSAVILRVHSLLYPSDMENDNDVPILRGIESILIVGATADLYRFLMANQKAISQENLYRAMKDDYVTRALLLDPRPRGEGTMGAYRSVWAV